LQLTGLKYSTGTPQILKQKELNIYPCRIIRFPNRDFRRWCIEEYQCLLDWWCIEEYQCLLDWWCIEEYRNLQD